MELEENEMSPEYAEAFGMELPTDGGTGEEGLPTDGGTGEELPPDGGTGEELPPDGGTGGEELTPDGGTGGEELTPDGGTGEEQLPQEQQPQQQQIFSAAAFAEQAQQAQRAQQAQMDAVYAKLFAGKVNPFTGAPIHSEADYIAYEQATRTVERNTNLQKVGLEPEMLSQLVDERVSQHPAVRQAESALQLAAAERARVVQQNARAAIAEGIRKISAECPEVKSLEDIAKLPTAAKFNELVGRGLEVEDAFFLANRQDLSGRRQAATRQAVINQSRSTAHLDSGAGGASGGVTVPREEAEAYRAMMPDASDADILKAWKAYQKELK